MIPHARAGREIRPRDSPPDRGGVPGIWLPPQGGCRQYDNQCRYRLGDSIMLCIRFALLALAVLLPCIPGRTAEAGQPPPAAPAGSRVTTALWFAHACGSP